MTFNDRSALVAAVEKSFTVADVLRLLGLSTSPGHYRRFHVAIHEFGIDTSHFTGQAHLKGRRHIAKVSRSLEEWLVKDGPYISSARLRERLLREGLLENRCATCQLQDTWNGHPITLELDHINGDYRDNRLGNLRILCPNCHSQAANHRGRSKGRYTPVRGKEINKCVFCGNLVSRKNFQCVPCSQKNREKIEWPEPEDVWNRVTESGFRAVGQELGVSDNAVRKFLRKHYSSLPKRGGAPGRSRPVVSDPSSRR